MHENKFNIYIKKVIESDRKGIGFVNREIRQAAQSGV